MTVLRKFLAIEYLSQAEVQIVILRCWTGLYFNLFKSYDTERKYFHFCFLRFCWKKLFCVVFFCDFCVFHLWHNFWTNCGVDPFRSSKWPSEPQFCERYSCNWHKKFVKWPAICHLQILGLFYFLPIVILLHLLFQSPWALFKYQKLLAV